MNQVVASRCDLAPTGICAHALRHNLIRAFIPQCPEIAMQHSRPSLWEYPQIITLVTSPSSISQPDTGKVGWRTMFRSQPSLTDILGTAVIMLSGIAYVDADGTKRRAFLCSFFPQSCQAAMPAQLDAAAEDMYSRSPPREVVPVDMIGRSLGGTPTSDMRTSFFREEARRF